MLISQDNDVEDTIIYQSRTIYVKVTFSGSPLLWPSKPQAETALSFAKAEYFALLQAMRVKGIR